MKVLQEREKIMIIKLEISFSCIIKSSTANEHYNYMKVKSDHRSKFSNLSNRKEAWKNQDFNRIQTRDLRDTGAMLSFIYNRSTNMSYPYILHIISLYGKIWTQ